VHLPPAAVFGASPASHSLEQVIRIARSGHCGFRPI
jgi:hypothetical protein